MADAPPDPGGLALSALVVGIVAFVVGWMPVVGLLLGIAAVVLAILALVKRQPKGLPLTGLVLGAVALVASLGMTIAAAFLLANPQAVSQLVGSAATQPALVVPDEAPDASPDAEVSPEQGEASGGALDIGTFAAFDDATFSAIAADPAAHVGVQGILHGEIQQFDEFTGPCAALAGVDDALQGSWEGYALTGLLFAYSGDTNCPEFAGVAPLSHVKAWVEVAGVTPLDFDDGTYDVATFVVYRIEHLPGLPQ